MRYPCVKLEMVLLHFDRNNIVNLGLVTYINVVENLLIGWAHIHTYMHVLILEKNGFQKISIRRNMNL